MAFYGPRGSSSGKVAGPAAKHAAPRDWVSWAVEQIEADGRRSAETHLIKLDLPCFDKIDIYLKDESTHPTGSLKHRLARSLFLYGLCNGFIQKGTPIVESSSGSTAISEAYFARLLGLPFLAVVPKTTQPEKLRAIEFYGGKCHLVEPTQIYEAAASLAAKMNGHYIDQFTYAERVTDWRRNNIAESIFNQLENERFPVPEYMVMSAGTGGTSATIGRYMRYRNYNTDLVVVDPQNSVFFDYYQTGDSTLKLKVGSRIEGIGRPRVEASFVRGVIDGMIQVADGATIATVQWLSEILGRKVGGSTGTNLWGALELAAKMKAAGKSGSIVTLICDGGDRYAQTYFNDDWVKEKVGDISHYREYLESYLPTSKTLTPVKPQCSSQVATQFISSPQKGIPVP